MQTGIRVLNFLFATILIVFFSIPALLTYVAIKITSRGPALYWSKRVGKGNTIFLMPKFRTMKTNTPQVATHLLLDSDSYLTSIGATLRKSSLDEIPQLWSVLVGDMNFVGPRPALFNQYDLIKLRTRHNISDIPPGITGWAQINGRDELTIEEKVNFDKYYVENRSIGFDTKILALTVYKVLIRSDISH